MVDALPYPRLLPSDSVVALGLQGPRRRQGGTVRIDIPPRRVGRPRRRWRASWWRCPSTATAARTR
ncbi:DUF4192 family protein [Streptacidiphilus sp. 4-A2]|nr:DUF4192 family protein [Streptacidiphilus sp. 4-A2]